MFFHLCGVSIQQIVTEEGNHLVCVQVGRRGLAHNVYTKLVVKLVN